MADEKPKAGKKTNFEQAADAKGLIVKRNGDTDAAKYEFWCAVAKGSKGWADNSEVSEAELDKAIEDVKNTKIGG